MTLRRLNPHLMAGLAALMLTDHRHFCNVPASAMAEVGVECKWRHAPVTISHEGMSFPGVTEAQVDQLYRDVAEAWMAVCGILIEFRPRDPGANVYSRRASIDGAYGVLADSYIPCGNVGRTNQMMQRYDIGEAWNPHFLFQVVLHEVGHALGLDHAPQGSGAIMEPYITAIDRPMAWDVQQMQARYGPPAPKPKPTPPPAPVPDPTPTPTPRPKPKKPRLGKLLKIDRPAGPFTMLPGQRFRFHFIAETPRLYTIVTRGDEALLMSLSYPNDPDRIIAVDDLHRGQGANARIAHKVPTPGVCVVDVWHLLPEGFGAFYIGVA